MKKVCGFFALLLFTGCAAPRVHTASGLNEVVVAAPPPKVRNEMAATLLARGYNLKRSDEFVIEAERDAGVAAGVLLGSGSNPHAQVRCRVNFVTDQSSIRVVVHAFLVDGHHNESPLAPHPSTQVWLDGVKQRCETP